MHVLFYLLVFQCPFCHKYDDIENAASDDKHFCLQKEPDGKMKFKTNHQYFYQVYIVI